MTVPQPARQWRKSRRSQDQGACVEVSYQDRAPVLVRDSKNTEGPQLTFPASAWTQGLSKL